jgi:hypothetical protein
MNKYWMVYVENQGTPTYKHGTYEEAKREAERLAQMPSLKGHRVYVFEAVSYCVCPPAIQWVSADEINYKDIPF